MNGLTLKQVKRLHQLSVEVKSLLVAIDEVGTSGYQTKGTEPGSITNKENLENQVGMVISKLKTMYDYQDLDTEVIINRVLKEMPSQIVCGL